MKHRMKVPILFSQQAHLKGNEKAPYNFLPLSNVSIWEHLLNNFDREKPPPMEDSSRALRKLVGLFGPGI